MKKIQVLILLSFLSISLMSGIEQITPPSFAFQNILTTPLQTYDAVFTENKELLLIEDLEQIKDGHPLRIAVGIQAEIELSDISHWISLPSGEKIWQQSIKSDDANGLILSFKELYIPKGDELYVYTKDRSQTQIYTNETNPTGDRFATGTLYQDEIILEYVKSRISNEKPRISISNIGYVYRSNKALMDDISCYINTSCEEGQDWQRQKNGIVGLEMSFPGRGGRDWYICSGSLINNVKQDKTPFILTANHCIEGYDTETLLTMRFDFFKESTSSNCKDQSYESTLTKTRTGAVLIADIPISNASDGTLLKLRSSIPDDWNVYYNGWDANDIAAEKGVSIHHPNGMVKKISTFLSPLIPASRINMGSNVYTGVNAHWEVKWSKTTNGQSVTYEGSSGSPIFNQNGHIVGTLTGGASFCDTPNKSDYYGRFSYHWDKYSDSKQHFKNYLDPDNTGILAIDGYDPHITYESTPTALNATEIYTTSFIANWIKVEEATKYWLDVYEIKNDQIIYLDNYYSRFVGDTSSYKIEGVEPEKDYFYVVRAGKDSYLSDSSNPISVSTPPIDLEAFTPTAYRAKSISENSFLASWKPIITATSFILNVYQKKEDDENIEYVNGYKDLNVGNTVEYTVTGLEYNERYYYTVIATDGNILSLPSNEISCIANPSFTDMEEETMSSEPKLYATGDFINIWSEISLNEDIYMYDITGQLILNTKFIGNEVQIPSGSLSKGIYFIKLGQNTFKILLR